MTDSWLDQPVHDGIVFAGDAAGWSNPLIGQGLSVALRDARVLTDALLADDRWTDDTLKGYTDERTERMRRLRVSMAVSSLIYDFGPKAADRRARIRAAMQVDPTSGRFAGHDRRRTLGVPRRSLHRRSLRHDRRLLNSASGRDPAAE